MVAKAIAAAKYQEMNNYLSEPLIPESGQPLVFWQDNRSRFPTLAQTARVYLCALCTSIASERLFSTVGHIGDEKRNKLSAKNTNICIEQFVSCLQELI